MTEKRFKIDEDGNITDTETDRTLFVENKYTECNYFFKLLNQLSDENEQLKKALLFFYDVANCECSTNWKEDMEKGCKRFFNCTYEEAKEKYGEYDGMWWEIND